MFSLLLDDTEESDDSDESEDIALPATPTNLNPREEIEWKFKMKMPEDFYDLWKFCKSLDKKNPKGRNLFVFFSLCFLRFQGQVSDWLWLDSDKAHDSCRTFSCDFSCLTSLEKKCASYTLYLLCIIVLSWNCVLTKLFDYLCINYCVYWYHETVHWQTFWSMHDCVYRFLETVLTTIFSHCIIIDFMNLFWYFLINALLCLLIPWTVYWQQFLSLHNIVFIGSMKLYWFCLLSMHYCVYWYHSTVLTLFFIL